MNQERAHNVQRMSISQYLDFLEQQPIDLLEHKSSSFDDDEITKFEGLSFEKVIRKAFKNFVDNNHVHLQIKRFEGHRLPHSIALMRTTKRSWLDIIKNEPILIRSFQNEPLKKFYELLEALNERYNDHGNLTVPPIFIQKIAEHFYKKMLAIPIIKETKAVKAKRKKISHFYAEEYPDSIEELKEELPPVITQPFIGEDYFSSEIKETIKQKDSWLAALELKESEEVALLIIPLYFDNIEEYRKNSSESRSQTPDLEVYEDFKKEKKEMETKPLFYIHENYFFPESLDSEEKQEKQYVADFKESKEIKNEFKIELEPQQLLLQESTSSKIKKYALTGAATLTLSAVSLGLYYFMPFISLLLDSGYNFLDCKDHSLTGISQWRQANQALLNQDTKKKFASLQILGSLVIAPSATCWSFADLILAIKSRGPGSLLSSSAGGISNIASATNAFAFAAQMFVCAASAHYESHLARERSTPRGFALDRVRKHTLLTQTIKKQKLKIKQLRRKKSNQINPDLKTEENKLNNLVEKQNRLAWQARAAYKYSLSKEKQTTKPLNDPLGNHPLIRSIPAEQLELSSEEKRIIEFQLKKQEIKVKQKEKERNEYLYCGTACLLIGFSCLFPAAALALIVLATLLLTKLLWSKFVHIHDSREITFRREKVFQHMKQFTALRKDEDIKSQLIQEYLGVTVNKTQFSEQDYELIINFQCQKKYLELHKKTAQSSSGFFHKESSSNPYQPSYTLSRA